MTDVNNSEDFIDTRDLIRAIDDLEGGREALQEDVDTAQETIDSLEADYEDLENDEGSTEDLNAIGYKIDEAREEKQRAEKALSDWHDDEGEDLKTLQNFAEQVEGYAADYHHGETLIRESYFTEYAEELVKDCYGLPSDLPSFLVIDWEATADNIKVDYSEAEFDGVTYYFR